MRSVDINRIAQALAAVPDPTELLSALFENIPIGLAIYQKQGDRIGRPIATNACYRRLFGDKQPNREAERVVQRSLEGDLVHTTVWFDALEVIASTERRQRSALELTSFPLRGPSGAIGHAAVCYLDVSSEYELRAQQERVLVRELVRENQQVDETGRQKSAFLASVSHELRTPLHTIIGYSDLLYSGRIEAGTEEHRAALGDVLTSGRHLLHLIDDVIDLARIEAGTIELRPEPVVLAALIDEVRLATQPFAAASAPIEIVVDLDPAVGEVTLDPVRLKQLLYNYVSNAMKFVPDAGQVIIRIIADGPDWFRLEVEDTGKGIAPEDLDRLFNEFAQVPGARRERGTGIGLALTRRLVEAQGGTVGARSALGRGSVFHARLPRSPRSPRSACTIRMAAVAVDGN